MVENLKTFKIGTAIPTSRATNKRDIESWTNLPLTQYIQTSLVANNGKYKKEVDWSRIAIDNAVVANLGIN